MVHPRLTSVNGATSTFLANLGPYGAWGDLSWTTRWGEGACGMFEASWTMPLPPDFEHPLLRRGSLVELMDGPVRIGSPLILSEPAVGTGLDDPWKLVATGIGREVEGDASTFLALDGSGNRNNQGQTVVDQAIARGWRIAGRDASIPSGGVSSSATSDDLVSVGTVLTSIVNLSTTQRWLVDDDNLVKIVSDPTTPTWHVTPGAAAFGVADDAYATAVYVFYTNSSGGALATVSSSASAANTQAKFGRREFPVDMTGIGPMPTSNAQAIADAILAKVKGRLGWTNGLTLTSQELLSNGGVPADLSMVKAGQMVRLHGIFSDLLEYNGQTYYDFIIGETKYTDGAQAIDINPMGLAPRDLAKIVEELGGQAA